jgi:hypothetical protein
VIGIKSEKEAEEIKHTNRQRARSIYSAWSSSRSSKSTFSTPSSSKNSLPGKRYCFNGQRRQHWVEAYFDGILVKMFPDNCSDLSLVSEAFVKRHPSLVIDTTVLQLPDGRKISSCGQLKADVRFEGNAETFTMDFAVVPGCTHDVLLAGQFLRTTETFTTFKYRIQPEFQSTQRIVKVCYQGFSQHRVYGSINGHPVSASPDTGSDVNVISRSEADVLGLDISSDPEKTMLEFVD